MTAVPRLLRSALLLGLGAVGGCIHQPAILPLNQQKVLDRRVVETPSGFVLKTYIEGLNCPTALCFDPDGSLLIAESGADGAEPHIFGFRPDGKYFNVYPHNRNVSFSPTGFVIYGPIGGMVAANGRVYVSHRDRDGFGVITAFGYDGTHTTIVAGLPARGDYGVTDLVVGPKDRLYFGIGSATNSGVVGVDNLDRWLKRYPDVHDEMYAPNGGSIVLRGYHFNSPNPWSGIFNNSGLSVTAPFQAFGHSTQSRVRSSDKPNSAICSVALDGGDFEVYAWGLHNPRGLVFDESKHLFATNDGMELRGTRPVADDPDVLILISPHTWYGGFDYSTTGRPISDPQYAPPLSLLVPGGYDALSQLIDRDASNLRISRDFDSVLLAAQFPSLSGAAKVALVPSTGPFKEMQGSIVVALDGDKGPFATSGQKLVGRIGFKLAIVDMLNKEVRDFVRNTAGKPASDQPFGTSALERPCDIKFGPDGNAYILDFGRMDNSGPVPRYYNGSGAVYRLMPTAAAGGK